MIKRQSDEADPSAASPGRMASTEDEEQEISLRPYFHTVWLYRGPMVAALLGVLVLFVTFWVTAVMVLPSERLASVGFRLLFEGADKGQYPNLTKFSPTEIVSTSVLTEVFEANKLGRFGRFEDFKDALFIQQSNRELDMLSAEYQAKLADTRLTPVDRSRLEEEFRKKRESLTIPQYALTLRRHERFKSLPKSLMEKVLGDILSVWAKQADERKGATKYDIPMFSQNALDRSTIDKEDYLVAIDMLRAKAARIIDNVDKIAKLPGANVVRTPKEKMSLAEVRANLEDIVRFQLEPIIGVVLSEGLSKNPRLLGLYAQGQLFQVKLERTEAEGRVRALQGSLQDYMAQRLGRAVETTAGATGGGAGPAPNVNSGSVIPQLGESFLDRLIQMSSESAKSDMTYRQKLTDRIIDESEKMVTYEREADYYANLDNVVKGMGSRASGGDALAVVVRAKTIDAFEGISRGVEQLTAIYQELSAHNLNASTLLYTITDPFVERTERSTSFGSFLLSGLLVMMLSGIVIPIGCLIHHALRTERARHPNQSAATI